jgi:hypothetical protein
MVLAANIPLKTTGDVAESWFVEADYHVPEIDSNFSFPFDVGKSYRVSRDLNRTGVYNMLEKTFYR